ncbi:MAG: hypothetical protein ACI9Y8_001317 [Candidatus Omnitrophota bacterium]|jgi:hypothetical protein
MRINVLNKQVVVALMVFTYLIAPCTPTVCHALTNVVENEAADHHDHAGKVHSHEHGADHHAIPRCDRTPAVTNQKAQSSHAGALEESQVSLSALIDAFQDLQRTPMPNLGAPRPQLEQVYLSAFSAHAPPA